MIMLPGCGQVHVFQLMLIPDDKVHLIRQLLNDEIKITIEDQDDLMTNPWKDLLGGEEP